MATSRKHCAQITLMEGGIPVGVDTKLKFNEKYLQSLLYLVIPSSDSNQPMIRTFSRGQPMSKALFLEAVGASRDLSANKVSIPETDDKTEIEELLNMLSNETIIGGPYNIGQGKLNTLIDDLMKERGIIQININQNITNNNNNCNVQSISGSSTNNNTVSQPTSPQRTLTTSTTSVEDHNLHISTFKPLLNELSDKILYYWDKKLEDLFKRIETLISPKFKQLDSLETKLDAISVAITKADAYSQSHKDITDLSHTKNEPIIIQRRSKLEDKVEIKSSSSQATAVGLRKPRVKKEKKKKNKATKDDSDSPNEPNIESRGPKRKMNIFEQKQMEDARQRQKQRRTVAISSSIPKSLALPKLEKEGQEEDVDSGEDDPTDNESSPSDSDDNTRIMI
jgi:hypothetical protein